MSVSRFLQRAAGLDIPVDVRTMSESTHTAREAAVAVGCEVGAIVKSLLFLAGDEPLLVLASGPNRVDTGLVAEVVQAPVAMADAKSVKALSGYSIGGVPPFGHTTKLRTLLDEDLLSYDEVWAAAGAATAVFAIAPARLAELTGAEAVRVS